MNICIRIVKDELGYAFGILYPAGEVEKPVCVLGYAEMKNLRTELNAYFNKRVDE